MLQNVQYLKLDDDLVILRALSSKEISIKSWNRPLDRLGESMARVFDYSYYPRLLTKTRETNAMKSLSAPERKAELASVYKTDANIFNLNYRDVLLIDDVVTTGTTACAIIKSILDEFSDAKITVFTLAWTPTQQQQAYIHQLENKKMMANEPDAAYGPASKPDWVDEDFENGITHISVLPL